jgi:DNA 3'-phosphatase
MKHILFMDLDGTIIDTVSGKTFPDFIGDFKFKTGILESLKNFVYKNNTKYLFIVSNQGGIGNGFVKEKSFNKKIDFICCCLEDFIDKYSFQIQYQYCKTNRQDNEWRKPNIKMLTYLLNKYVKSKDLIKKEDMLMIGDASGLEGQFSDSDKKTAENFGIDYMDIDEFISKNNYVE